MVNNNSLEGVNHVKLVEAIKGGETKADAPLNQKSNLGGSALGLYQVVDGTRTEVYNRYYKENMTKSEFDNLYLKDGQFQKVVASKVSEMYLPKSIEQNQNYNIPVEYASTLNYFLGPKGGDIYLKYYNSSSNNHSFAQQKYNDWYLQEYGKANPNTNIRDYVHKAMNRYYN